jgi:RNA polymerase sigma factor (sigma-70 family)
MSAQTPTTQASLLARLQQGADVEAWNLFVELYTPLIYRFARRRLLQDADASDITQKVMARVYKAMNRFAYDPERGRFRNWLGAITVREIIRHRQREARREKRSGTAKKRTLNDEILGTAEGEWQEEFNAYVLSTALTRIRDHFDALVWQAFDWTWVQNVEPQTAAQKLGKSTAWIYKARFRVLKRLRAEVMFLAEDAAFLHRPS